MSAHHDGLNGASGTSPSGSDRTGVSAATEQSQIEKPADLEKAVGEKGTSKGSPPVDYPQQDSDIIDWDGPDDPGRPYNFSNGRKWIITGTALLSTFLVPMHGTSITVAAHDIASEFNISDASFPNSYLPVLSWGVGCAVFIIVGLPLMEDFGVRRGFMATYILFFIFIIPQAVAPNFQTLVVSRFFSGGFGELPTSAVASIIPDLWDDGAGRSLPISLLNLLCMLGLTIAPAVFAPVIQYVHDWRWIFYIQLIVYGAMFPLVFLFLEETRGEVILKRRAKEVRRKQPGSNVRAQSEINAPNFRHILLKSVHRPFYLLGTEPVLVAISVWSAFNFGTVFLFTQSTEQVFAGLYGWGSWKSGYVLIAVAAGEILGWMANGYSIRLYTKSASRNAEFPGMPIPEARLYVSIFGTVLGMACGMFVYGWTSYPSVPWIAPAIGLAMVGFGIQVSVNAACDYLEDAYACSDYAASAVSALAALENAFAAFLPLASTAMYSSLGYRWASSLLGILALLTGIGPALFVWKGQWFRGRSAFMASGGRSGSHVTISGQHREYVPGG